MQQYTGSTMTNRFPLSVVTLLLLERLYYFDEFSCHQ
jgi:hypothetical protein